MQYRTVDLLRQKSTLFCSYLSSYNTIVQFAEVGARIQGVHELADLQTPKCCVCLCRGHVKVTLTGGRFCVRQLDGTEHTYHTDRDHFMRTLRHQVRARCVLCLSH